MKIELNKKEIEVGENSTLNDLVIDMNIPQKGVAIAINNRVIGKDNWHTTILNGGDKVTIIKAVCGG